MSEQATRQATRQDVTEDPWEKYSWLMASIWLVFLLFPITGVVASDVPTPLKVLGVALIAVFAAVYVQGFVRMGRCTDAEMHRWSPWYLLVLALLTLAVTALIGFGTLGMVVFLVSFAMFGLPPRWAYAVGALAVVVVVLAPLAAGTLGEVWPILPILVLVGGVTALIRTLEDRQVVHRGLQDEVALVAERERVARDVHDVLGHTLTVLVVKAELAERLVDRDPERAKDEMAQVQSLTREALAEVRATVAGLRIARLGDELAAARDVLADAGIAAEVPQDASVVDPRHRLVLAWVLREAVTNVVRHSAAARCAVLLEPTAMVVLDDGVGRADARMGNGLRGITERVRAAGGKLDLGPGTDGRGTRVEVRWA